MNLMLPGQKRGNLRDLPYQMWLSIHPSILDPTLSMTSSSQMSGNSSFHTPMAIQLEGQLSIQLGIKNLETHNDIRSPFLHFWHNVRHVELFGHFLHDVINNGFHLLLPESMQKLIIIISEYYIPCSGLSTSPSWLPWLQLKHSSEKFFWCWS